MSFIAVNPATGQPVSTYDLLDDAELETALATADEAQRLWRIRSVAERAEHLRALGAVIRERKAALAARMTTEMGKPITQAIGEAEKCAWVCDYYAENAAEHLASVPVETDATTSYWAYRPLGVIFGIMPWNFPFWQVIRFAVPTITAGNAALLKHSQNVPGCAQDLEDLFRDAGYPEGLFANLFIDHDQAGDLIEDPRVRAVSLTGSVRAGKAVAKRAGSVLKSCVLELGGSDPSLVLADADLDLAAAACALGRFNNTGQSCIAAKRFIVVDEVRDAFQDKLLAEMEKWQPGDPTHPDTKLGPMARQDLRDELHDQVQRSVDAGAELVTGGTIPDRPGAWYPPTLLSGVTSGMPAYHEELFGPVASILPVSDEEEAIRVANDSSFGLGAAVYTRDEKRGEHIAAEHLDAGNCFVNGIVKSDPRLPFGGTKDSGFGRELSPLGIREFTNRKTVWVK